MKKRFLIVILCLLCTVAFSQTTKKKGKKKIDIPINPEALQRHSRGDGMDFSGVKTKFHQIKFKRNELNIEYATEQAARAEVLLQEDQGYLEADEGEDTAEITQNEIIRNVDILSATKNFQLNLDFGPYRVRYTKNGRFVLLGGRKGHVAGFDWLKKSLYCEMNVMESVFDVTWLMNETLYAVAQKNWVHVYDRVGTEIHCIKNMNRVVRLEYLPYHFLLNSINDQGYLSWVDVSVGKQVAGYFSSQGRVSQMCQNPYNGVTCLGGSKGVVSLWAPSVREPLAKMLCHKMPLTAIAVDTKGIHLATAGLDKTVKLWDIRQLEGPVQTYHLNCAASGIEISQKGLMAISMGNYTEIYRKYVNDDAECIKPYLRQQTTGTVSNIRFVPFEDVLGIATAKGFSSILVPGAGEPNFDTFEANPFQSKSQRKEQEIKDVLEKIPMEFISLDPTQIAEVDVPTMKDKLEARANVLYLKAPKVEVVPRNRARRKNATKFKSKKSVKEKMDKEFYQNVKAAKDEILKEARQESADFIPLESSGPKSVLDRFKAKKKKKN